MSSIANLYQDFVDGLRDVLPSTTTPDEPCCYICGTDYGHPGSGVKTNLDYLNELAYPICKSFVQHIVEPVTTPCGHNFCKFCICIWLLEKENPTCPMCRTVIEVPCYLRDWVNINYVNPNSAAITGISQTHHVSTRKAQEIFNILQMGVRQLLTAPRPEKFTWNTVAMLSDLPKVMVTVARRFFFRAKGFRMPADQPHLRLHNPMDRFAGTRPDEITKDLEYLSSRHAPLANHPDGHRLYALLYDRILDLDDFLGDRTGVVADSFHQAKELFFMILEDMPDADGGVDREKWWAYVNCVITALIVWQGYCRYVVQLTTGQVTQVVVDEARAEEGVQAFTIG